MIHIRKNSLWHWLWRFNQRWSVCPPDDYTNLCQFMRCILIWMPLKFVSAALAVTFLAVWFDEVWPALAISTLVLSGLVGVLSGVYYAEQNDIHPLGRISDSLVWQYIKAKKRKICPLVEVH